MFDLSDLVGRTLTPDLKDEILYRLTEEITNLPVMADVRGGVMNVDNHPDYSISGFLDQSDGTLHMMIDVKKDSVMGRSLMRGGDND